MKLIYPAILAGAALVGVAAFTPSLAGKPPHVHHLTVPLPGGGTETITYTGDVMPKVTMNPASLGFAWPAPIAVGVMPSFVSLDRMSGDMDREMDAFLHQVDTLARLPAGTDPGNAALQKLPAGGASYSLISESVGNGICTRMVQITQRADGEKPEVVSRASGNCDADTAKARTPEPTSKAPEAIHAKMTTSTPVGLKTLL